MSRPRPETARDDPASAPSIDGPALARALAGGAAALGTQRAALDAINVFPVPDGDTGTNMTSTMEEALAAVSSAAGDTLDVVASAAARGALMGAKGNSGVILSQILAGFAALPEPVATLDAAALAAALIRARDAAYRAVSEPREGTILTAIDAAAAGARDAAAAGAAAEETLIAAVDAAHDAVARTPDLLPLLREAGVVDAGAQGLYVFLDGMRRALAGEEAAAPADLGAIDPEWLRATRRQHEEGGAAAGFCTEFIVEGAGLDEDAARKRLTSMGDSVLVVGGPRLLHAHVHAARPDDVLAYARSLGAVSHEKVEDMEAQFRRLAAGDAPPADAAGVAVVAVAAGAGMQALLRSLGAAQIVPGGQTMNPSAGDIRRAIEATGAAAVIVLPNNPNVILAARQAAVGLAARVRVVETRSVPQAIAALVAMSPEAPLDERACAMEQAIAAVRTCEVTRAARATRIDDLAVGKGQPIGLVDGDLVASGASIEDAALACVERALPGEDALLTLYYGEGVEAAAAERLSEALRERFHCDVELVDGGQPHYPYVIGVE